MPDSRADYAQIERRIFETIGLSPAQREILGIDLARDEEREILGIDFARDDRTVVRVSRRRGMSMLAAFEVLYGGMQGFGQSLSLVSRTIRLDQERIGQSVSRAMASLPPKPIFRHSRWDWLMQRR